MPPCHGGDREFKSRPDRHVRNQRNIEFLFFYIQNTESRFSMETMTKFEKVSYAQYFNSLKDICDEATIKASYDAIKLPKRATKRSAGYDFFAPLSFTLQPNETIKIATGIRVSIAGNYFLGIFPRSGLGFKYRLQLDNTVGIIDADYYDSDNEGHIFIKLTNDTNANKTVTINQGEGFAQGIFIPFGLTDDDQVTNTRNGGLGSTTQQ